MMSSGTATTEIYTLSLHDALPIYFGRIGGGRALPHLPRALVDHAAPCGEAAHAGEHARDLDQAAAGDGGAALALHLVGRQLVEEAGGDGGSPVAVNAPVGGAADDGELARARQADIGE